MLSLAASEPLHRAFQVAANATRRVGSFLIDVALPPLCPVCRRPLAAAGGICAVCWGRIDFITPPYCERLGIPFAYDPGPGVISREAVLDPPAYNRARAVARYDEVAASLVHALKYGDRLDLAPMLGRWMATSGRELIARADALVPVPLHWRRLWARRFNQSAALAAAVGRVCGLSVEHDLLARVRATAQQVGLGRDARAANVQGAFAVPEEARPRVEGRRLLLVDDVLTSGATAQACARALSRAGAANVDVLVFARVVNGDRLPI